MPANTKRKIEQLQQRRLDWLNSVLIQKYLDYGEVLSSDLVNFLMNYAMANGSCLGHAFMTVLAAISLLGSAIIGLKVSRNGGEWLMNLKMFCVICICFCSVHSRSICIPLGI